MSENVSVRNDPAKVRDILSKYNRGVNVTDIQTEYGISFDTLYGILKDNGIVLRTRKKREAADITALDAIGKKLLEQRNMGLGDTEEKVKVFLTDSEKIGYFNHKATAGKLGMSEETAKRAAKAYASGKKVDHNIEKLFIGKRVPDKTVLKDGNDVKI